MLLQVDADRIHEAALDVEDTAYRVGRGLELTAQERVPRVALLRCVYELTLRLS